jgi:hypothetical protein
VANNSRILDGVEREDRRRDPRGSPIKDQQLAQRRLRPLFVRTHLAERRARPFQCVTDGTVMLDDESFVAPTGDHASVRTVIGSCRRHERRERLPYAGQFLFEAPIGPKLPKHQRYNDGPYRATAIGRDPGDLRG